MVSLVKMILIVRVDYFQDEYQNKTERFIGSSPMAGSH